MTLNPHVRVHNTDVVGIYPKTKSIVFVVHLEGDPETLSKEVVLKQMAAETRTACNYLIAEGFLPDNNGNGWRTSVSGVFNPIKDEK